MNDATLANLGRSGRSGPPSVATTVDDLASDVGSVVGEPTNAFLRSITFVKTDEELQWGITLADPMDRKSKRKNRLVVTGIEGVVTKSLIQPGDYLKSVNGKRIGPSFNAERAMNLMKTKYDEEGYLSVAVGNKEGDDVLVQATVIKPKPTMKYEDSGMIVWFWGKLCIKSIDKDSIFRKTVMQARDHIISINDIAVEKPEHFAHIFSNLQDEVTMVVWRGKQRWNGKFG